MKILTLSALLAIAVVTGAFATGENKVSSVVLQSFSVDFAGATNVSWTSRTGYAKAAFILNKRQMEVFYDQWGNTFAVSKNIDLDELPVSAKRAFAKKYDGYTVKEAIRFEGTTERAYFLKAENEKESVVLKVDDDERLSVFDKTKKMR